jgi:hypothetical protein
MFVFLLSTFALPGLRVTALWNENPYGFVTSVVLVITGALSLFALLKIIHSKSYKSADTAFAALLILELILITSSATAWVVYGSSGGSSAFFLFGLIGCSIPFLHATVQNASRIIRSYTKLPDGPLPRYMHSGAAIGLYALLAGFLLNVWHILTSGSDAASMNSISYQVASTAILFVLLILAIRILKFL